MRLLVMGYVDQNTDIEAEKSLPKVHPWAGFLMQCAQ